MSKTNVIGFQAFKAPLLHQRQSTWNVCKLLFLFLFSLTAEIGVAASFDCAKAGTVVEKAICSDKLLNRLDEVLSDNYKQAAAANIGASIKADLRSSQRSWLLTRNKCSDANCIASSYKERIDAICSDYTTVLSGVAPMCTGSTDVEAEFKTQSAPPAAQKAPAAQPKPVASGNDQKIKALGLPANFLNSTLYINYLGQWTPLMPCTQFLSQLFDNKKISGVESLSRNGNPGIAIKVPGRPAVGFLFRMEGKDGYLHAFDFSGKTSVLSTPADHSQSAVALQVFASGEVP